MGIGHFAVGLALKKAEPRLNLGPVILSVYLSDFFLGVFVWLGLEQYHIPPDFAARRYMTFTFPYSVSTSTNSRSSTVRLALWLRMPIVVVS